MNTSWPALAATPAFFVMAVLTAILDHGPADVLCGAGHGSPLTGMATMYLLMSAFHAGPWLKRVTRSPPSADRA